MRVDVLFCFVIYFCWASCICASALMAALICSGSFGQTFTSLASSAGRFWTSNSFPKNKPETSSRFSEARLIFSTDVNAPFATTCGPSLGDVDCLRNVDLIRVCCFQRIIKKWFVLVKQRLMKLAEMQQSNV